MMVLLTFHCWGILDHWTIDLIDVGSGTTISSVNNSINHQFNNLSPGIYQIVATDTTGCTNDTIIQINLSTFI